MKYLYLLVLVLFSFAVEASNLPTIPVFYVKNFGPTNTCNGATDDSAAFLAAGNAALASVPHGIVQIPSGPCKVAISSNLTLPGVTYQGDLTAYGYNSNFATAPYTLLINPAYTINPSSNTSLVGVRIYPYLMGQQASTLRGALTMIASFSGTAITIPSNEYDITIDHVMINGFTTAISHSSSDRVHYSYVEGDDTNFLNMNGCGDTCTVNQMEAWDFLASPYALGSQQSQTSNISSFSSGPGSTVEVTLTTTPATPLITGDTVIIGNTGATYQFPNGRWVITAIDSTHFTLNGSTYSSASATSEIAFIAVGLRQGTAFYFANTGIVLSQLTEYGHDIGLQYGTGSGSMTCNECWFDGDGAANSYADPTPIGVVNGATPGNAAVLTQQNKIVGSSIYQKAISIYNNSSSSRPLLVTNTTPIQDTGVSANLSGSGVYVASGSVFVSNSDFEGAVSGNIFYVADAATQLSLSNIHTEGGVASYQTTSTDCPKYSLDGVIFCAWTPILTIGGSSTGITYSRQLGQYQQVGNEITANFCLILTSIGGLTGNVVLTNFPVTVSSGLDAVGMGGLILTYSNLSTVTGYPVVNMSNNTTTGLISQATVQLTASNLANNSVLCGQAMYRK